ncbi:unnamed protein product [Rhodiola kirilowii]
MTSESHDMTHCRSLAMQVFNINRFSPSSRTHAVNDIKRKGGCDTFPRVLIFPEGTTTNVRAVIPFQLGAFIPGVHSMLLFVILMYILINHGTYLFVVEGRRDGIAFGSLPNPGRRPKSKT